MPAGTLPSPGHAWGAMLLVLLGPLPHSRVGGQPGQWSQTHYRPRSFFPPPQHLGAEEATPQSQGLCVPSKSLFLSPTAAQGGEEWVLAVQRAAVVC